MKLKIEFTSEVETSKPESFIEAIENMRQQILDFALALRQEGLDLLFNKVSANKEVALAPESITTLPKLVTTAKRVNTTTLSDLEKGFDEEEKPHIVAAPMTAAVKKAVNNKELPSNEVCIEKVYDIVKHTKNTEHIVSALLDADPSLSLSISDIADACHLNANVVNSWFAQTGKKIPHIISPGRGMYKFDRTSIKQ